MIKHVDYDLDSEAPDRWLRHTTAGEDGMGRGLTVGNNG